MYVFEILLNNELLRAKFIPFHITTFNLISPASGCYIIPTINTLIAAEKH